MQVLNFPQILANATIYRARVGECRPYASPDAALAYEDGWRSAQRGDAAPELIQTPFGEGWIDAQLEMRRAAYVSALKRHDWTWEFADDGRAYRAGRAELARLMIEASEVDPTFELWNRFCPMAHRRGSAS